MIQCQKCGKVMKHRYWGRHTKDENLKSMGKDYICLADIPNSYCRKESPE